MHLAIHTVHTVRTLCAPLAPATPYYEPGPAIRLCQASGS